MKDLLAKPLRAICFQILRLMLRVVFKRPSSFLLFPPLRMTICG